MIYRTTYHSPLGVITLVSDGEALIGLWIEGQQSFLSSVNEEILDTPHLQIFIDTSNWLDRYFNKEKPSWDELNLAPRGSEFRQEVWNILREIPYGETTSYGAIAKKIAASRGLARMSAQAVGGAVGNNPISIIVPCHRVIGSNGELTGYAGGLDKKIWLLEHERGDL